MFNIFDLNVIPTFLSRFKVEKVLAIGFANERIMDEVISFCIDNNAILCAADSKRDIDDLIKKYDEYDDFKDNVEYFKEDSLSVLPKLNNLGAVFIDGDPNWYTVYNELTLIKENNPNFPIIFICNNKYPHKRRDSYSNPDKIPDEFKNECCNDLPILYEEDNETKRTMVKDGFCHAIDKDTPKNGVLTAIEDFLKENSSLKFLDINPLEGVSLIYQPSEIVDARINTILKEQVDYEYSINELSDKFIENDILLRHVSRVNVLKDDLDRVEEFKSEIEDKNHQLKEYEEKIDIQDSQIKYKDSQLNAVESQISLGETKLQSAEAKLLKKDNELKAKDVQLSSKDDVIKFKEEQLDSVNSQLLTKENELKTTQDRLANLESSFLDNRKELDAAKKQLSKVETGSNIGENKESTELQNEINSLKIKLTQKDAQIKSANRRVNALRNANAEPVTKTNKSNIKSKSNKKDESHKGSLDSLSLLYLIAKSKSNDMGINIKLFKALKNSGCFDSDYYLNKYPDLAQSKWCKYFSPQLHYVCIGFDENRKFSRKMYNTKSKEELLKDIENK